MIDQKLLGGKVLGGWMGSIEYLKFLEVLRLSWLMQLSNITGQLGILKDERLGGRGCFSKRTTGGYFPIFGCHRVIEISWDFAKLVHISSVDRLRASSCLTWRSLSVLGLS